MPSLPSTVCLVYRAAAGTYTLHFLPSLLGSLSSWLYSFGTSIFLSFFATSHDLWRTLSAPPFHALLEGAVGASSVCEACPLFPFRAPFRLLPLAAIPLFWQLRCCIFAPLHWCKTRILRVITRFPRYSLCSPGAGFPCAFAAALNLASRPGTIRTILACGLCPSALDLLHAS